MDSLSCVRIFDGHTNEVRVLEVCGVVLTPGEVDSGGGSGSGGGGGGGGSRGGGGRRDLSALSGPGPGLAPGPVPAPGSVAHTILASGGADTVIRCWRLDTDAVNDAVLGGGGSGVAGGGGVGGGGRRRRRRRSTKSQRYDLVGHRDGVRALQAHLVPERGLFWLFSASDDKTIMQWDLKYMSACRRFKVGWLGDGFGGGC